MWCSDSTCSTDMEGVWHGFGRSSPPHYRCFSPGILLSPAKTLINGSHSCILSRQLWRRLHPDIFTSFIYSLHWIMESSRSHAFLSSTRISCPAGNFPRSFNCNPPNSAFTVSAATFFCTCMKDREGKRERKKTASIPFSNFRRARRLCQESGLRIPTLLEAPLAAG